MGVIKKNIRLIYITLLMVFTIVTGANFPIQQGKELVEIILCRTLPYHKIEDKGESPSIMSFLIGLYEGDPYPLIKRIVPTPRPVRQPLKVVQGYFSKSYLDSKKSREVVVRENKVSKNKLVPIPTIYDLDRFKDLDYVYRTFYTAPSKMDFGLDMLAKWDFRQLAKLPISFKNKEDGPKILIFHTHIREEYIGGQGVKDIGEELKKELETKYGLKVMHCTQDFYEKWNTSKYVSGVEYEIMGPYIEKVLEDNPSIEMTIDLHRDGLGENIHLVREVNNKKTAPIMFVNGLCMNRNIEGKIEEKIGLTNPYLKENLALSLQMQMKINALYPGWTRKIYLNEWRYSTHMKPYGLLIELGSETNTYQEALNAVEPLAQIIAKVMEKD